MELKRHGAEWLHEPGEKCGKGSCYIVAVYDEAIAFAASEREAGRKQAIDELEADYKLHLQRFVADEAFEMALLRSREPGPTKLEKLDAVEGWGAETMARAFNALVDATTANTEAIARMGGKT